MNECRSAQLRNLVAGIGTVDPNLDLDLINTALTHPSFAHESVAMGLKDNQRLEFLGDAVIDLAVAEYLFRAFPDQPEGELTRRRAQLVCTRSLAMVAKQLDLGGCLLLGKGEELSGGRNRLSNLADALEAIIGAFFLSVGWNDTKALVWQLLTSHPDSVLSVQNKDWKSALQEKFHKAYGKSVYYQVIREFGPDHEKQFEAAVFFEGKLLGSGNGRSKKEAEQEAAREALSSE